jgi:hypothetical protein
MTDPIQFACTDPDFNKGLDHFEYFGSQPACHSHFFNIFRSFSADGHQ